MQKLSLKPTPINEPIKKKDNLPKKKNKFTLQKKTKTDRAENIINNTKNNEKKINIKGKNETKNEELINNEINEDDFIEPKEEKMLINKEDENYKINQINNNIKKEEDLDEDEIIVNKKESNMFGETQSNIPYIIEEQENLIANHMDIIKNEAQLLTEEGNLISKIKGITEENYSMEEYVPKIEQIIEEKLNYFKELKQKIKDYKSLLG